VILLVEDDMMMAEVVGETIRAHGLPFRWAHDFRTATKLLQGLKFDVVITDFHFPGGNGDAILELATQAGVKEVFLHSGTPEDSCRLASYTGVLNKSDPRDLKGVLKALKARA
jgi:DNA-binding response OmpR family regulator